MAEVHPLLSRQLQKYSGDNLSSPRACKRFFKVIDETYHEFDNDRAMLERALEISSREHIQERDQMLKVREIALGIESKYTLDEVLEFIVESARQIPGIHLVFLNRLDETGKLITTPYYSRIGNQELLESLRIAGFEVSAFLGKSLDYKNIGFEISKLKAAEEFWKNPRELNFDKLSDLMDGALPKNICDKIQKAIGFTRTVSIPLFVESNPWGSLAFFVDNRVATDILEMVTAHCALGIKNTLTLESLRKNNIERENTNKRLEQALKELSDSEKKYAALVEGSKDVVAIVQDGLIKFANGQIVKVLGFQLDEIIDKPFLNYVHPLSVGLTIKKYKERLEGREIPRDFLIDIVTKEMKVIKAEINTSLLEYQGKPAVMVVARDITERKKAEQSIKDSERALKEAQTLGKIGNWEYDLATKQVKWSEEMYHLCHRDIALGPLPLDSMIELEMTPNGHIFVGNEFTNNFVSMSTVHGFEIKVSGKKQRLNKLLETGETVQYDVAMRLDDGVFHMFDNVIKAVKNDTGNVTKIIGSVQDITERKKAEQAVAESERALKEAQTLGKIGNWEYDLTTKQVKWSEEMFNLCDRDSALGPLPLEQVFQLEAKSGNRTFVKNDYLGDAEKTIIHGFEVDVQGEIVDFTKAVESGEPVNDEIFVKLDNGTKKVLNLTTKVFKDKLGTMQKIIGTVQDITERKKAEQAVAESERALKEAQTLGKIGNWEYDLVTKQAKWSEEMYRLSGRDPSLGPQPIESILTHIRDFNEEILKKRGFANEPVNDITFHGNGKNNYGMTVKILNFNESGDTIQYDTSLTAPNGTCKFFHVISKAIRNNQGQTIKTIGTVQDITERKLAEEQVLVQKQLTDRIIASALDSIVVVGKDGRVIMANKMFERIFNLPDGKTEGKQIETIIPASLLTESISEVLKFGEQKVRIESKIKLGSSDRYFNSDIVSTQKNEVFIVMRDMTNIKEMQENLYLTDRLASLGEMAAGVAHEINNPLTGVISLSELLLEGNVPDEIKDDLKTISQEGQRAAHVVKNLLSFARKHATSNQIVDVNAVVGDVINLRAYEHKVNNIKVETHLDYELPKITADSFQLKQVFLNIILNAEHAMVEANKRGNLSVTTKYDGSTVRILFTNDGPFIPPEIMNKIFNPFFTTKEVGKGTGLGLSICYGIITNLGGKIYAENRDEGGVTFTIEIPVMS